MSHQCAVAIVTGRSGCGWCGTVRGAGSRTAAWWSAASAVEVEGEPEAEAAAAAAEEAAAAEAEAEAEAGKGAEADEGWTGATTTDVLARLSRRVTSDCTQASNCVNAAAVVGSRHIMMAVSSASLRD